MEEKSKTLKQIVNDVAGWYTIKENKRTVYYTLYTKTNLFTDKAVCDDRDEFDVEKGKRLAKLRAILKMKLFKRDQILTELEIARMYLNDRSYEALVNLYKSQLQALRASIGHLKEKIETAS